jgi:hypothetical protein
MKNQCFFRYTVQYIRKQAVMFRAKFFAPVKDTINRNKKYCKILQCLNGYGASPVPAGCQQYTDKAPTF